jgi:hypothetical protein
MRLGYDHEWWKEVTEVCFKVISQHLSWENEENHENPRTAGSMAKIQTNCHINLLGSIQWISGTLSPGVKWLEHVTSTHHHLVSQLRICGAISWLPLGSKWLALTLQIPEVMTRVSWFLSDFLNKYWGSILKCASTTSFHISFPIHQTQ